MFKTGLYRTHKSKHVLLLDRKIVKVGSMKEIKGDKSLEKVFLELEG